MIGRACTQILYDTHLDTTVLRNLPNGCEPQNLEPRGLASAPGTWIQSLRSGIWVDPCTGNIKWQAFLFLFGSVFTSKPNDCEPQIHEHRNQHQRWETGFGSGGQTTGLTPHRHHQIASFLPSIRVDIDRQSLHPNHICTHRVPPHEPKWDQRLARACLTQRTERPCAWCDDDDDDVLLTMTTTNGHAHGAVSKANYWMTPMPHTSYR